MPWVARLGDLNSAGGGNLTGSASRTFAEGLPICRTTDIAVADLSCVSVGGLHCDPAAMEASLTVYCEGLAVHRHGDLRVCGDTNIATARRTFVGG